MSYLDLAWLENLSGLNWKKICSGGGNVSIKVNNCPCSLGHDA